MLTADFGELLESGILYGTIYADPPWPYRNQRTRAATHNHYPTMSMEAICALPVEAIAAADAFLHLWVTSSFAEEGFHVMDAWGFKYVSEFVWVKPQLGLGNYFRMSHEQMYLGVRGQPTFRNAPSRSWIKANRTRHSEKPAVVRDIVRQVGPGPYLELFGREAVEGWSVFGDQIRKPEPMLFHIGSAHLQR